MQRQVTVPMNHVSPRVHQAICECCRENRNFTMVGVGSPRKHFRVTPTSMKACKYHKRTSSILSTKHLFLLCLIPELLQSQMCFLTEGIMNSNINHSCSQKKQRDTGGRKRERDGNLFTQKRSRVLPWGRTAWSFCCFSPRSSSQCVVSVLTVPLAQGCRVQSRSAL